MEKTDRELLDEYYTVFNIVGVDRFFLEKSIELIHKDISDGKDLTVEQRLTVENAIYYLRSKNKYNE